ncbi:MAG: hypothetical protein FJ265_12535 [Planctomycetes bacterium]|nr:hypothetical protein [Planctomycetota bacterium]
MRFPVDRCAGAKLARWLRSVGHDVRDAGESERDPGDAELLALAVAEDRILVTIDLDFGPLVFAGDATHRGIVRLPDCPASERIAILETLLARHRDDLEARAVITVRSGRVRVSRRGS